MSYMPSLVAVFGALAHVVPAFTTATDAGAPLIRVALKVPPLLADGACAAGVFLLASGRRSGNATGSGPLPSGLRASNTTMSRSR